MRNKLTTLLVGSFLTLGFATGVSADNHDGDRDCDSFASSQEVLEFWTANGYNENFDPHDLDRDDDNLACEVTQSEYDAFIADSVDTNEQPPADENTDGTTDEDEEGEPLPDTATNNPLMMLFGAALAGAGSLMAIRRKEGKTQA